MLDSINLGHLVAAGIAALGTALAAWMPKKSRTVSKTETVDGEVLAQFLSLAVKVTELEVDLTKVQARLAETASELESALQSLAKMQSVEEELRLIAIEREKEIERLRQRVKHLENLCDTYGIKSMEDR